MVLKSIRGHLRRLANAVLRPFELELHGRAALDAARRATHAGAFERLARAGFVPQTVIDVGVADGTPSLYRAFPDARHVLVEPVEECRPFLEAIARQFRNVEYVVAAATRHAGPVRLNVHTDVARSSVYWESDYEPGSVTVREVPGVTLDQLRRDLDLRPPLLLKIDVQGAELDVLAGATETLKVTEFVILEASLLEFFPGAPLLADIVAYMNGQGFAVYDVVALQYRPFDGTLTMADVAFVREAGRFRTLHRFHPTGRPVR